MALADRYRQIADLPRRIPLFPLRGVILLPRAELPLNVFEPRYLAMLDDVIAGNRLLGIVQPAETQRPARARTATPCRLKRFGCVGRLTAFRELDDGRLLITLTGIARFATVEEAATPKPYRLADVAYEGFAADLAADASAERTRPHRRTAHAQGLSGSTQAAGRLERDQSRPARAARQRPRDDEPVRTRGETGTAGGARPRGAHRRADRTRRDGDRVDWRRPRRHPAVDRMEMTS